PDDGEPGRIIIPHNWAKGLFRDNLRKYDIVLRLVCTSCAKTRQSQSVRGIKITTPAKKTTNCRIVGGKCDYGEVEPIGPNILCEVTFRGGVAGHTHSRLANLLQVLDIECNRSDEPCPIIVECFR